MLNRGPNKLAELLLVQKALLHREINAAYNVVLQEFSDRFSKG